MPLGVLRIGKIEIRTDERLVFVGGSVANVAGRAFDVLVALARNAGSVVSRQVLIEAAWPDTVVEENNLAVQVWSLRRTLGNETIKTIAGRGYQLVATDFPEQAGLRATAGGGELSTDAHDLVGREEDRRTILGLLRECRVVSLVGPGGVGKTALARSLVGMPSQIDPSKCWWVDLARLREAGDVPLAVARACGCALAAGTGPHLLGTALRDRTGLLVVDNCEHLLDTVAATIHSVWTHAPGMRMLITSQGALHLAIEGVYRVQPLKVPPRDATFASGELTASIALLERRVQAKDSRFNVHLANWHLAADICRRLDGLPLAIEMAAAKVPLLGLTGVQQRLSGSLDLLKDPSRITDGRHRSIVSMLDWSQSLLSSDERNLLERLAVFAGSIDLETALADTSGGPAEAQLLDALTALVDKSLVQVETDASRFRLLDSVRRDTLRRSADGGRLETVRALHSAAMLRVALQGLEDYWRRSDVDWLRQYGSHYDDLELAFDRACAAGDASLGGPVGEVLQWLDLERHVFAKIPARKLAALTLLNHASTANDRARLWNCLALCSMISIPQVRRLHIAEQRLKAWVDVGNLQQIYLAYSYQGAEMARAHRDPDSARAFAEACAIVDSSWPAKLLWLAAEFAWYAAQYRGTEIEREKAANTLIDRARVANKSMVMDDVPLMLADSAIINGDFDAAREFLWNALTSSGLSDRPVNLGLARLGYAFVLCQSGQPAAAAQIAFKGFSTVWHNALAAFATDTVALIAAHVGEFEVAGSLLGFGDFQYELNEDMRSGADAVVYRLLVQHLDDTIGSTARERLSVAGRTMDSDTAYSMCDAFLRPRSGGAVASATLRLVGEA